MIDSTEKIYGNYRGKVLAIDTNESSKSGKLKIEVYPCFEGIDYEYIPWAVPAMPLFDGAGSGYGCLNIPTVGSYVWVFFEAGDIYQPVYFAEAQTPDVGIPSEALTNYPTRKVLKTSGGVIVYIDDTSDTIVIENDSGNVVQIDDEITLTHSTGSKIYIDSAGNINIEGKAVTIDGTSIDITTTSGLGYISMSALGAVVIEGLTVDINPV